MHPPSGAYHTRLLRTKAWLIVSVALATGVTAAIAVIVLRGPEANASAYLPAIPRELRSGDRDVDAAQLVADGILQKETVRILRLGISGGELAARVGAERDETSGVARIVVRGFTRARTRAVADRLSTRLVERWNAARDRAQDSLNTLVGRRDRLSRVLAISQDRVAAGPGASQETLTGLIEGERLLLDLDARIRTADGPRLAGAFVMERATTSTVGDLTAPVIALALGLLLGAAVAVAAVSLTARKQGSKQAEVVEG